MESEKRDPDGASAVWDEYYASGSSRYRNEGDIGILYRLPKFVEMFQKHIASVDGMEILEIGGGAGEIYEIFRREFAGGNFHYTITEYSHNAVALLNKTYESNPDLAVAYADAENLPFESDSFDLVLAFDVLHHVGNPCRMIQEMARVSSKYIYLCDAGGLSLVRKITEISKEGRKNGEKSYTPKRIKSFFKEVTDNKIDITPFYFFVPPKISKKYIKPFKIISELGQRIPFLRWQSQSVAIFVDITDK